MYRGMAYQDTTYIYIYHIHYNIQIPWSSTTVFNIVFANTVFVRDKHPSSERPCLCVVRPPDFTRAREISVNSREIAVHDRVSP